MKYKAIIFDMDGTIVDTEKIWETATKTLIEKKGVKLSTEAERKLKRKIRGLATIKACEIIKEIANLPDSLQDLINEQNEIADALYKQEIKFIEGFLKFYAQLISYNLKTALATNAGDYTLEVTKKALNLENLFGEHIYNISHVNNMYKPHPHLYLHTAKQLDLEPAMCIAIEDSEHGINAAKAAGMFCIGINTSNNREFLENSDLIIDGYHEIDLEKLLKIK